VQGFAGKAVLSTAMQIPRQTPSPVHTPTAFRDGCVPWALETPTPCTVSAQEMSSDPFGLMLAASLMPTPKKHPASGVQASLSAAVGAADDEAAEETQPLAAPALPRIPHQLVREICLPFFEQMVQVVEEAIVKVHAEGAGRNALRHSSFEGDRANQDIAQRQPGADFEDYRFCADSRLIGAVSIDSSREPSLVGSTDARDDAKTEPSRTDDLAVESLSHQSVRRRKRLESDSSSSVCSTSAGSCDAPSPVNWQLEAAATGDHLMIGSAGIAGRGACITEAADGGVPIPVPSTSGVGGARHSTHGARALPAEGEIGASQVARHSKGASAKSSISKGVGGKGMVCCHWKNKGWCRYQDQCKFAHPEHKRGIGITGDLPTGRVQQLAGSLTKARCPLPSGLLIPAAQGHSMSCVALMPPSVQPLVAQAGRIYPLVANASGA